MSVLVDTAVELIAPEVAILAVASAALLGVVMAVVITFYN